MEGQLPEVPESTGIAVLEGLNQRAQAFARHLALTDNVMKSARLAGYAVGAHPSPSWYELAARPDIVAAVEYWRDVFQSSSQTSPEKVLAQLATMANADVALSVDDNWNTRLKSELPPELLAALTGIEVRETKGQRRVTLKFGKEFALEQLARIHRLYGDNNVNREGMSLTIHMGVQVNTAQHAQEHQGETYRILQEEPGDGDTSSPLEGQGSGGLSIHTTHDPE